MLITTALFIIGLVLLIYASDRLVYGAASIARQMGIPSLLIGTILVGIGTSIPELAISANAALNNQLDIAVGNALGSNITNILLIFGCLIVMTPIRLRSDIIHRALFLLLAITIISGFLLSNNTLSRMDGILLLLLLAAFLWTMVKMARLSQREGSDRLTYEQEIELPHGTNTTVATLWIILGLIILPLSSQIVIDNATILARYFNISELTIGLTLLAVGTSLPELATTVAAVLKKENHIALGNIIGSNIFNLLIVLGVPALLAPASFTPIAFARDYWIMLGATLLFMVICRYVRPKNQRIFGILMLFGFIAYIILLCR